MMLPGTGVLDTGSTSCRPGSKPEKSPLRSAAVGTNEMMPAGVLRRRVPWKVPK